MMKRIKIKVKMKMMTMMMVCDLADADADVLVMFSACQTQSCQISEMIIISIVVMLRRTFL